MVTEKPNVPPNARYTITQTAELLHVCTNSVRKYRDTLDIRMGERAIGGRFFTGMQVSFIWEKVSKYGI